VLVAALPAQRGKQVQRLRVVGDNDNPTAAAAAAATALQVSAAAAAVLAQHSKQVLCLRVVGHNHNLAGNSSIGFSKATALHISSMSAANLQTQQPMQTICENKG
jgi:hypothetical protein